MATLVQFQLRAQLSSYLQKAAGQTACARDASEALTPGLGVSFNARLAAMVKDLQLMQQELSEYNKRNQ